MAVEEIRSGAFARRFVVAAFVAMCGIVLAFGLAKPSTAFAANDLTADARAAIDTQALSEIESVRGPITQVALGDTHSAALLYDGTLWMWGYGDFGTGTATSNTTPKKVLDKVKQVSLGSNHSAALKTDGTLWMWGSNSFGQVGSGKKEDSSEPVKVLTNVKQVSLGSNHSAAVKNDGTVWTWGSNSAGQLGNGTTTNQAAPTQVKSLANVKQVALGAFHSAAVKNDGTLWMWGSNTSGQIGDGSTVPVYSPKSVGLTGVAAVSLGSSHSAALKSDGTLWTWGRNANGQLGDKTTTSRYRPVQVMDGVKSVALGNDHSAAIKSDNAMWMWGSNIYGQLGYQTMGNNYRTVPAISLRNVKSMGLGATHSAGICSNGSLWMWGANKQSQLGFGTTSNVTSPKQLFKGGESLAPANVKLSKTSFTYNGKRHSPSVTVTLGSKTLKKGVDYTLSISNNKNAGKGTVMITGTGYYTETASKTFTIKPASLSKAKLKLSKTAFTYDGKAKKPKTTLRLGKKKLKKGSNYTVSYPKDSKSVGKHTVKIKGKKNYKGSVSKSYTISPQASAIIATAPLRSSKSGAASVSWKKVSKECDGYELWLSTNKKFPGSSTKKAVFGSKSPAGKKCAFRGNGLEKRATYYIKVRTYKKAGGKTYYSKWSSVKSVRTI